MSEWLAGRLVKYQAWLLGFAVAIAALSIPASRQLNLDWNVEGMFPPGDPLVEAYFKLQERFGGNQVVLAVYRDPELWASDGSGLDRLTEATGRLAAVDGVDAVLSLSELHRILETLRKPLQMLDFSGDTIPPLLDPDDKLAQQYAAVFAGYTHQSGSEYVAIACLLDPAITSLDSGESNRASVLDELRQVMQSLSLPATEGLITGEPVLVADGFQMVRRDGWRLGITSTLLVLGVLLVCFRSVRWTLIPIAVVHWSLLATQAVLVGLRLELTMISSTLGAVVTVIGVATSMHILLKFQSFRRHGSSREEAIRQTLATMLAPVGWACVTDAVGFAALMIAGVGPVRDFGLMMAVGSLMVFVAIILLVPGLALLGRWADDPSTPKIDLAIRLALRRLLKFVLARRTAGLAILAGGVLFGILGSRRMVIETDFTKNFGATSSIVTGYTIIERELGGAGVWDIMLPAPPSISAAYLSQVELLEANLRAIDVVDNGVRARLTKVLSIADADAANRSAPLLSVLPVAARLRGMKTAMPEFTGALLSADVDAQGYRWLRIMLRSRERAPARVKEQLVASVRSELASFSASAEWRALFKEEPPQAEIAGYHVMLGALVASLLEDQWKCFLLATLGVYLVMALATGSLRLAAYALVPNALPILLVLGTMGWVRWPVNMGAAMIAAVSLGLSVDSSIHYLIHYRRRLAEGMGQLKALRSAEENVGLAVVLATVALIAGFLSLCMSEFVPTVVFGTLASLTMLGGLIGNLVVLPILLASESRRS